MAPLLPVLDVPDEKTSLPLPPAVPALADLIVMAPLDVAVPSPELKLTAPPVCTVLRPEYTCTEPPAPLVPLPTDTETRPPRPAVAAAVPSISAPLLPVLELPELNTSAPLAPVVPEFALRIVTTPLDVDVPSPLLRLTAPPVCTVLRPDDI
jgi:hypothetical protein